jgi:hypothetical protein
MVRVLLLKDDEKLVEEALTHTGKRDIYLAMDENVENRFRIEALGLDRYALVGADVDHSAYDVVLGGSKPAPKKTYGKKSKKEELAAEVEAVADESSEEILE